MADQKNEMSLAELRERVRAVVVEVLSRMGNSKMPPSPAVDPQTGMNRKHILLLFMSDDPVAPDFFAQVQSLARQGYSSSVVFSRTFEQSHDTAGVLSQLGNKADVVNRSDDPAVRKSVERAGVVLVPNLSLNTAAKVAVGISDCAPCVVILQALLQGKPVFIGQEIASFGKDLALRYPAIPPALLRTAEDHVHKLQHMGVRFTAVSRLAGDLGAELSEPVNETPERLAKTKPSPKRQFIVEDDIREAASRGHKEIIHSRAAVITDQARERAHQAGITLVSE